MKTIKIFLASSSELEKERDEFEIFIRRKNDNLSELDIYLTVVRWENFIDAMSKTRLQDEYNKAIVDCDIFVSLFHTKVGKYTEEEFLKALKTFMDNGKPLIYTYFNREKVQITPDIVSLINFQQKLSDSGHFYTKYDGIKDLKFKFNEQLEKVLPKLTGISPSKIQQHNAQVDQTAPKVVQNFYSSVETSTGNIGRDQNITNIKNKGNRNIKIGQGNYNENIQGDYIDQSRTQNISGGTINTSGAGAFSMGNNYGTLANTVNQNSDSDNSSKSQLKKILIQLQNTINQENLDNDTKSDFLDEIKVILDALPNSQNDFIKKQANKSIRALKRIADDLPSNSATVNLCTQIPDLITQVF